MRTASSSKSLVWAREKRACARFGFTTVVASAPTVVESELLQFCDGRALLVEADAVAGDKLAERQVSSDHEGGVFSNVWEHPGS